MEAMIRQGMFRGVIDLTTHELIDELAGGEHTAGPDRLEAASAMGIPQVICPGATDYIVAGPFAGLKKAFKRRKTIMHNPEMTFVRPSDREMALLGKTMARKANRSRGNTVVVIPLKGFSYPNHEGRPLYNPTGVRAFVRGLQGEIDASIPVRLLPMHINDEAFAAAVVDEFKKLACYSPRIRPAIRGSQQKSLKKSEFALRSWQEEIIDKVYERLRLLNLRTMAAIGNLDKSGSAEFHQPLCPPVPGSWCRPWLLPSPGCGYGYERGKAQNSPVSKRCRIGRIPQGPSGEEPVFVPVTISGKAWMKAGGNILWIAASNPAAIPFPEPSSPEPAGPPCPVRERRPVHPPRSVGQTSRHAGWPTATDMKPPRPLPSTSVCWGSPSADIISAI